MNVYILNSKINATYADGIILHEKDFHPCVPFFIRHPEIQPETIQRIYVRGIFEQHPYIRTVLKYCDYMLAKGGILEIDFFNRYFDGRGIGIRARNDWQYELSMVFKDRVSLVKQDKGLNGKFVYKKNACFLPVDDSIEKWTFGIVSDGRKNERILQIIDRINSFGIPQYEILICGPAPSATRLDNVRVLSDAHLYSDLRIPISKKKNLIIQEAKYNNLIIMHDRIIPSKDWYANMLKYGNYWDCLSCRIINEENHALRMADWQETNSKPPRPKILDIFFTKERTLNYDEWSPDIYIAGGFFQIKKHLGIKLAPYLYWGEKEDVDMSVRAYNDGVLFTFYPDNVLYSQCVRFKGSSMKSSFFHVIRCKLGALKRFVIDCKDLARYLKTQ